MGVSVDSDERNAVVGELSVRFGWDEKRKRQVSAGLGLELKPLTWMRWTFEAEYERTNNQEAWVMNTPAGEAIFGDRGTNAYDFTLRGTLAFNRELTVEYYGQIFLAKGRYDGYRILVGDGGFDPTSETADLRGRDFNSQSLNSNPVLRNTCPGVRCFRLVAGAYRRPS